MTSVTPPRVPDSKIHPMSPESAIAVSHKAAELEKALRRVIRGKDDVVRLALVSIFARGHLLIEGVPGVGKTTLGQALARAIDCTFQRVQFTSDMLPSDVLGISVYSSLDQEFEFKRGPVFTNVLLADEINRTTPKTQSALLEAMNEGQVTVDAHSYELPQPFLVIATQNPVEHHGTYPLPESQLDRFLMRVRMGYPEAAAEREILRSEAGAGVLQDLRPVLSGADVLEMQAGCEAAFAWMNLWSPTRWRLCGGRGSRNICHWEFRRAERRRSIARRRPWHFSMAAGSALRKISSLWRYRCSPIASWSTADTLRR